jgi:hypothetical protein
MYGCASPRAIDLQSLAPQTFSDCTSFAEATPGKASAASAQTRSFFMVGSFGE